MLILRPPGRGNWTPVVLQIPESRHSPLPLELPVGTVIPIAGVQFRVAKVMP